MAGLSCRDPTVEDQHRSVLEVVSDEVRDGYGGFIKVAVNQHDGRLSD